MLGGFEEKTSILYLPRPTLWLLLIGCVVICEAAVFYFAPVELGVVRRALGGVLLGAWCFICLFINRMLVS